MFATATIEPRLIALLSDTSLDSYLPSHLELPPLQDPNVQKAPGRPSPLEPQAGTHHDESSSLVGQQSLSFDRDVNHSVLTSTSCGNEGLKTTTTSLDRALGGTSPQSLRKILEDIPDPTQLSASKKRLRTNNSKDDFVQLPQPPKKQKAAKQVVPPIIIGLFEPPPNAALFPPISSSAFHDSHGRNSLNVGPPDEAKDLVPSKNQAQSKEEPRREELSKKPNARTWKKWTETETTHMLLGVKKYGIGSWTKILQDPEFKFNGRKAVDLKDRFRTCCPEEFFESAMPASLAAGPRDSSCPTGSNIPSAPPDDTPGDEVYLSSEGSNNDVRIAAEPKKSRGSRAHRKKVEDLAQLGIKEPFKKSKRRERRFFSEEEDRNILRGWEKYKASWTVMQKDPELGLGSRRPMDLRDRLRNLHPGKYNNLEDKFMNAAKHIPGTGIIGSMLHTPMSFDTSDSISSQDRGQKQSQHVSLLQEPRIAVKTPTHLPPPVLPTKDTGADLLDQPSTNETSESPPFSQSFDWSDGTDGTIAPFQSSLSESYFSRILDN